METPAGLLLPAVISGPLNLLLLCARAGFTYRSSVTLLHVFVGQVVDQLQPAGHSSTFG